MNALEQIISKQIEWANNKGLKLIGSQGARGRKVYTTKLHENLFQPLTSQSRKDLEGGDGGELIGTETRPAKIQALHSSSAIGINLFDYWRNSTDLSTITSSCGISRKGRVFSGNIRFEQKLPIDERFAFAPNIDVVILPHSGAFKCYAIECKFTEAYSGRGHGGLDPKYFDNENVWEGLIAIRQLADAISPDDDQYKFLHAAQLIKHILGLNRKYRKSSYRLLYLYYDALGEPGFRHRQEVDEFTQVARSDGVAFHHITYQELITRLAQYRDQHTEYIRYLTERYL
ncbi:MAG: hypothetical protein KAV87_32525 [Desulfobacteraceae bacterium]|nr:hypothetical protein [Desulfobacteraceae bacterium]